MTTAHASTTLARVGLSHMLLGLAWLDELDPHTLTFQLTRHCRISRERLVLHWELTP